VDKEKFKLHHKSKTPVFPKTTRIIQATNKTYSIDHKKKTPNMYSLTHERKKKKTLKSQQSNLTKQNLNPTPTRASITN
jgi:hypothetical protein